MGRSRRKWSKDDGKFAKEVADVCAEGIAKFQRSPAMQKVIPKIADLLVLGESVKSRLNFGERLDDLFRTAIHRLESPAERAAAPQNFGLKGTASYGLNREARQEKAAEEYSKITGGPLTGITYRQNNLYERAIIVGVATEVERIDNETRIPATDGTIASFLGCQEDKGSYVPRPIYDHAFKSALADSRIIVLVGAPGVGKSRLVRALVENSRIRDVVYLKCDESLAVNAIFALRERGVDYIPAGDRQSLFSFLSLAYSDSAPECVVLEGLSDPALLEAVDLARLNTVIVATSDYRVRQMTGAELISVRPLAIGEAIQIAHHFLPDISASDLRRLVEVVDCSPQLIRIAAELVHSGTVVDIESFCRSVAQNIVFVARHPESDLIRRYNTALEALRSGDSDAAEILENIALLSDPVPVGLVVAAVAKSLNIEPEKAKDLRFVVMRALTDLQFNSLAVVDGQFIRLTNLARDVIRHIIFSEGRDATVSRLRSLLRRQLELVGRSSRNMDEFMDETRLIVNHLFHLERGHSTNEDAARKVAVVVNSVFEDLRLGQLVSVRPVVDVVSGRSGPIRELTFCIDLTRFDADVRVNIERIMRNLRLPRLD